MFLLYCGTSLNGGVALEKKRYSNGILIPDFFLTYLMASKVEPETDISSSSSEMIGGRNTFRKEAIDFSQGIFQEFRNSWKFCSDNLWYLTTSNNTRNIILHVFIKYILMNKFIAISRQRLLTFHWAPFIWVTFHCVTVNIYIISTVSWLNQSEFFYPFVTYYIAYSPARGFLIVVWFSLHKPSIHIYNIIQLRPIWL